MSEIHLVTDDDAIDELVRLMFASLPIEFVLSNGSRCAGALIVRRSSIESEFAALQKSNHPALIVLDGSVRRRASDAACIDGGPAAEMLRELRKQDRQIPILVVASASFEKLECEVLLRWDVGIWRPPPPANLHDLDSAHKEFAEILSGLNNDPGHRRITVTVRPQSATYRIFDGHYLFTMEREYKIGYQPRQLISQMKRFNPIENKQVRQVWQQELSEAGRALYSLLLEDVFGASLLERLKREKHGVEIRFHLDLMNEGMDAEFDDLFLLPFEATNSNMKTEGFFCATVPMARRVGRFEQKELGTLSYSSIKVLLVVGARGGDASVSSESTAEISSGELSFLKHADDVRQYFNDLRVRHESRQEPASGGPSIQIDVLDNMVATDVEFQRELQKKLIYNEYNIVHFYGHSVGGPDGTFLFAPGTGDLVAHPISIRAVAKWMGDKRGKDRAPDLVFLSSCQSISVRTAVEMMKAGVSGVLGFRWEVDENVAIEFVREFYKSYVEFGQSVIEAYRSACSEARVVNMGQPLWASAILIN
jgi:CheY-like chemotaxis protein